MRRREFLGVLGGAAVAWPVEAMAQQPALPVVGLLRSSKAADSQPLVAALRQGLRESGYIEGKNFSFAFRFAEGHRDRLPGLAADLVRLRVAVIVANTYATLALMSATKSIPIVFVIGGDPVIEGLVSNLNHPGGNTTGVNFFTIPAAPKRLGLLHELVPRAHTIAMLVDPHFRPAAGELAALKTSAQEIGLKIVAFKVENEREIDDAFSAMTQVGADALFMGSGSFFRGQQRQIVRLAALHKIPAIYQQGHFVEAGGLMSYGGDQLEAYRRAGDYVSRILKGEKPGDLPVELSTKFELVINLKTAKALGLTIPPMLLARANMVIQ
jgi:putative ABC transport system substrate-binding protein